MLEKLNCLRYSKNRYSRIFGRSGRPHIPICTPSPPQSRSRIMPVGLPALLPFAPTLGASNMPARHGCPGGSGVEARVRRDRCRYSTGSNRFEAAPPRTVAGSARLPGQSRSSSRSLLAAIVDVDVVQPAVDVGAVGAGGRRMRRLIFPLPTSGRERSRRRVNCPQIASTAMLRDDRKRARRRRGAPRAHTRARTRANARLSWKANAHNGRKTTG